MTQAAVIAVNIAWVAAVPLVLSWAVSKPSPDAFRKPPFLYRQQKWEKDGKFYEKLGIKKWKDRLPDAGGWFRGGFPKKQLTAGTVSQLNRFILETNRGELVHWLQILAAGGFFLWNELLTAWIFAVYTILFNLPFIAIQRYNRFRLARTLGKRLNRQQ